MELKVQIPFQQFLTAVKTLTPTQKVRLQKELTEEKNNEGDKEAYIEMLLHGPVFTEKEIQTVEENRKHYRI
jgi:hypothetical protein